MIKAVIPVAGLGTRLLSATKGQPKEMLPIFSKDNGTLCLKPMVQLIFENLFEFGIRDFYFVVGKGKRAIEDQFTADSNFTRLHGNGNTTQTLMLEAFHKMIRASTIVWVNQQEPRGFGDAVLQVESLVGKKSFLVVAGDTYLSSESYNIHSQITQFHEMGQAEATLTLKEVNDPKHYGVAEAVGLIDDRHLAVQRVIEKPEFPTSRLAIMPLYVFNARIFTALRDTNPGKNGEIQLTDAIQKLIDMGHKIQAIKLRAEDTHLDIGTPETYWNALRLSYERASKKEITETSEPYVNSYT